MANGKDNDNEEPEEEVIAPETEVLQEGYDQTGGERERKENRTEDKEEESN